MTDRVNDPAMTPDDPDDLAPQPSIDLKVRLSEYLPGCGTVLVEVSPPCLLHNASHLHLRVGSSQETQHSITLRPGATVAPQLGHVSLIILHNSGSLVYMRPSAKKKKKEN